MKRSISDERDLGIVNYECHRGGEEKTTRSGNKKENKKLFFFFFFQEIEKNRTRRYESAL